MSSNNDIIKSSTTCDKWVGVTDYGICCDRCEFEIEDGVTGYWKDGVTGFWKDDVRYCSICVWDFVNQPKRITAHEIWRRQDEVRKEERIREREQHEMEDSDEDAESAEEEYNGSKDFPPNDTDEQCPICLEAYTPQKQRDGIRCSDIPSNCSHYCCERCWYVIWGQHNDTNNCPICKRDITMWLSTHYPNQAIADFLKTLPPPK